MIENIILGNIILGKLQITCCTVTEQKGTDYQVVYVLLECLLLQSSYTLVL